MVTMNEYSQNVTDKVVEQISNGAALWQQPLAVGETRPVINDVNGFAFNGVNSLILQMEGRDDPRWMDFYAAQHNNLKISKGSIGVVIEDVQTSAKKPVITKDGEPVLGDDGKETFEYVKLERPIVRHKHFFNAADIENIGENKHELEALPDGLLTLRRADSMLDDV